MNLPADEKWKSVGQQFQQRAVVTLTNDPWWNFNVVLLHQAQIDFAELASGTFLRKRYGGQAPSQAVAREFPQIHQGEGGHRRKDAIGSTGIKLGNTPSKERTARHAPTSVQITGAD